MGYGDDKLSYRLCDPKKRKLIRDRDIMFREDQTFGGFEKEEIPQEYVPRSIEERDEMHASIREEEDDIIDPSLPPPSNDEEDVDEFFYGGVNDFIDDDE